MTPQAEQPKLPREPERTRLAAEPEKTRTAGEPERTRLAAEPEQTRMAGEPEQTRTAVELGENTQLVSRSELSHLKLNRAQRLKEHLLRIREAQWRPVKPLPPGVSPRMVPGCTLQGVIGVGGMGTVYLARQNALNRQVAVKVLTPKLANNPGFIAKLRKEAQIMAMLSHPNLVGCHDIIVSQKGAYVIMEYIPGHLNGRTLVRLLGPMPQQYVTSVLHAAAKGLSYAYEKGYTHRDVKPDNLLFGFSENRPPDSYEELFESPEFRITLCDFGIAAPPGELFLDEVDDPDDLEGTTALDFDEKPIVGSPLYMAPEQALFPENVDCRSDIYSLASTAYYLLTGAPPFPGKSLEEVIDLKSQIDLPKPVPPPPAPPVPQELSRVIQKMGMLQQEERYQDYPHLLDDLARLEAPYLANFSLGFLTRRYRKFLNRLFLGTLAVGMLVFLGIYGYMAWLDRYEQQLMQENVHLAKWSGALFSWQQEIHGDESALVGGANSGPLTLKEPLRPGDYLRVGIQMMDIGGTTMHIHTRGDKERILMRLVCYRDDAQNVIQMDAVKEDPNATDGFAYVPVTVPRDFPDANSNIVELRIQMQPGYFVVWNQGIPLAICHYDKKLSVPDAQFTIARVNSTLVRFSDIAQVRGRVADSDKMADEKTPRL